MRHICMHSGTKNAAEAEEETEVPRRGRKAEENHRRKGQGAKHRGGVSASWKKVTYFPKSEGKKRVSKSTEIIRCSRVAF